MAINKNAVIRYNTLDRCFSNFGRKYYFKDLLNIVNEALLEINPNSDGIKERQLRDDIAFMKSDAGYSSPIAAYREGKKAFYRYSEREFSIHNSPLNQTEINQLKNSIAVLQRFEGAPQFEWLNELSPILQDRLGLKNDDRKIMGFNSNIDYTGYNLIPVLFDAISNNRVLKLSYKTFKDEVFEYSFHPYYLKEYRHRWFAVGRNDSLNHNQWVVALDRITNTEEVDLEYIKDYTDWEDFFYDVVGVTRNNIEQTADIELLFSSEKAPYIETKPIHPSQKHRRKDDGKLLVKLKLIPNYELMELLFGFGPDVEIISPNSLRDDMIKKAKKLIELYTKK